MEAGDVRQIQSELVKFKERKKQISVDATFRGRGLLESGMRG
jgi:hypothetical protein